MPGDQVQAADAISWLLEERNEKKLSFVDEDVPVLDV